ncbi:MAG: surface protein [Bacteroidaceae bacterium]|nr:surface protein [Bacteroidaceae bacterium]
MTTVAMNNLWTYIQGLSLSQRNRKWLADKLVEPIEDTKTAQQKAYVKETLTRALKEVEQAKREGRKLQTLDEFIQELRMEEAQ